MLHGWRGGGAGRGRLCFGSTETDHRPAVGISRHAAGNCRSGPSCRRDIRQAAGAGRSEEHTSELQSLMRISYAVFCLKKKNKSTSKNKKREQQYKSKHISTNM